MKTTKLIATLLVAAISTLVLSSCQKSHNEPAVIKSTADGYTADDYYVKATVNGETFHSCYNDIITFKGYDEITNDSISGFSANYNQTAIQIDFLLTKGTEYFTIYEATNRYPNGNYSNYSKGIKNSDDYITYNVLNWQEATSPKIGEINITRNDEQVFAGTFSYIATNSEGKQVHVENGAFQFPYAVQFLYIQSE